MADPPTNKDLCEALSALFANSEIDYDAILSVAGAFPASHVETVLFEWVAPVCHVNTLAAIPPVWSGFEPERLWRNIIRYRRMEARAGPVGRGFSRARRFYLRRMFARQWRELEKRLAETPA